MNYSGMNYTLGLGVASTGLLFPLVSPFLGWIAVFLSGSDTSGNALFGNLQVVAANQLGLNPVLFAATNSSGGVMGKMISPQNISTGATVTDLKGKEGVVFARTFKHSIALTLLLGVLVLLQQYVMPWMISTFLKRFKTAHHSKWPTHIPRSDFSSPVSPISSGLAPHSPRLPCCGAPAARSRPRRSRPAAASRPIIRAIAAMRRQSRETS